MFTRLLPLLLLFVFANAYAFEVAGHNYPDTILADGNTLNLVGAGLREATFLKIDIYTGAIYTKTPTCSFQAIVNKDEPKVFKMDFVRRVPGKNLMDTMKKNFADHTPANASDYLKDRIRRFITLFNGDSHKGMAVEIHYLPGKGTWVTIDGRLHGPTTPGLDFAKVVFDIWFGKHTATPDLYRDVRKSCRNR